jgi:hypothetical protein
LGPAVLHVTSPDNLVDVSRDTDKYVFIVPSAEALKPLVSRTKSPICDIALPDECGVHLAQLDTTVGDSNKSADPISQ